jgi:hypothetical protein
MTENINNELTYGVLKLVRQEMREGVCFRKVAHGVADWRCLLA